MVGSGGGRVRGEEVVGVRWVVGVRGREWWGQGVVGSGGGGLGGGVVSVRGMGGVRGGGGGQRVGVQGWGSRW